ncbi:hypothetical protein ACFLU5_16115 [Bacteroidota bacterium]
MKRNIGFLEYLNIPDVISSSGFFVSIPMRHEVLKLISAAINIISPTDIINMAMILIDGLKKSILIIESGKTNGTSLKDNTNATYSQITNKNIKKISIIAFSNPLPDPITNTLIPFRWRNIVLPINMNKKIHKLKRVK